MDTLRYYIVPLTTFIGVLGFLLGGPWVWLGIANFPVLMLLDVLLPRDFAPRQIRSSLLADVPLYLHLLLMLALYAAFIRSVATGTNPLSGPDAVSQIIGSVLSLTWLSAVPNLPVNHELMHRRHWFPRWAAQILGTFYGDPNRDIAHVRTHHLYLDTHRDSDTPLRGETIYRFMFRATWGAYADSVHGEAERLRKQGRSAWHRSNRTYMLLLYVAAVPLSCYVFAGTGAMLIALTTVIFAKLLLEGFNYFQHYGLVRLDGGPILKHHAWNHLGPVARALGVEITNHINHHLDGYTRFYELKPEPRAPQMPSLFLCFVLGLIPPLWFRFIAKPRLKDWDERFATTAEKKLAMEANAKAGWPQWVSA